MSHALSEFILICLFDAQVAFIIIISNVENGVLSIQARVKAIAKNLPKAQDILLFLNV